VLTVRPQGPASSYDPREPTIPKRVQRGGSYLCDEHYCASYRPSARMKASPDTSLVHTGFRCVMAPDIAARSTAALPPQQTKGVTLQMYDAAYVAYRAYISKAGAGRCKPELASKPTIPHYE